MVVVKLIGGLGNQLFQYAIGRNLTDKLGSRLKLDASFFKTQKKRKFALDTFNFVPNVMAAEELPDFNIVRERLGFFNQGVLGQSGDVYLDGYWQSEKYFTDISSVIREDFSVRSALKGKNLIFSDQMKSCESVALHVRRGDYISEPSIVKSHGFCGLSYYQEAVQRLLRRVPKAHFFLFSDDLPWVKENLLQFVRPATIVDANHGETAYQDLRLMNLCRHHIIANSSFSWWGAWLSRHENKIVYAPRRWFRKDHWKDMIPLSWEII